MGSSARGTYHKREHSYQQAIGIDPVEVMTLSVPGLAQHRHRPRDQIAQSESGRRRVGLARKGGRARNIHMPGHKPRNDSFATSIGARTVFAILLEVWQ